MSPWNHVNHDTLTETGMPSAVILFRATHPISASVLCLSNFLAWSLPPVGPFSIAIYSIVSKVETGPLPPRGFSEGRSHSDVLISLGKNPVWSLRNHGILGRRDYNPCVRIPLQYSPVGGFSVIGSVAEERFEAGSSLIKQIRNLRTVAFM